MSLPISVANVSKRFRKSDGGELTALASATFDVQAGRFCSLIGVSGCGKSTLLNIIAGLTPPSSGEIRIGGQPVNGFNPRVGYMFQKDTLLPWSTALGNVKVPMEVQGRRDDGEAQQLLELVGLRGFEQSYPYQLSGGMRKRVQLARLLAQHPEVLLLDEPFGALDAYTKLQLQEELLGICQQKQSTVLFVTHDLYEAIALSDRIILMSSRPGRIEAEYEVGIPRPRDLVAVVSDPAFRQLFAEIYSAQRKHLDGSSRV
jgi:NitT/TauT family transport system ATP-binding protein